MSGHAHRPLEHAFDYPAPAQTAFTEAELADLAREVTDWTRTDGITRASRVLRVARVLELAATGDLEVIRCTCELYGVATCPTCG